MAAASSAAPPADVPVYLLMGHGGESFIPYSERNKLPAGYTLVTFSECGMTTNVVDTYDTLQHMTKTKPFDDPIGNKKAIEALLGRKIRVYSAGMPFPDVQYSSTAGHIMPDRNGKQYTIYFKSGVHKLPIHLEEVPEWETTDDVFIHKPTQYPFVKDEPMVKYGYLIEDPDEVTMEELEKERETTRLAYSGAVFPDKDTVEAIVMATRHDDKFPISEVFEALGPGVYYWLICRGDPADVPPGIADLRAASNANQPQGGRKSRTKTKRSRLQTRRRKHRNGSASVRRHKTRRVLSRKVPTRNQ